MKKISTKIIALKNYFLAHKIIGIFIIAFAIAGGYITVSKLTSTSGITRYVLGTVSRETIISSITGSGQVAASNQIDLKSKASGDVASVNVVSGQEIKAGTLIASIDSRDARIALETAQISYQKLTKPADALSTLQAQNAVDGAIETKTKSENNLIGYYGDGLADVSAAFIDLPTIMENMETLLYTQNGFLSDQNSLLLSPQARKYRDDAGINFDIAKNEYETNLEDYKNISKTSNTSALEKIITETYDTIRALSQSLKDAKNTVDYIQNNKESTSPSLTATQTNLNDWLTKINSHLSALASLKSNIDNEKISVTSAERTIAEKNQSLKDLESGADPLDIQSEKLSLEQKENAYNDSFIRAPFDGVVAKLTVKKLDSISSGTSIGTFITKQKVADISLNEVDVAKIKTGHKVTLTFDAIDGLTVTGSVIDVDLIGTVSQGVVNYNVKIGFDTEDDRVKSGMSVSATIITDVKQDALAVPASAIKTSSVGSYVEIFNPKLSTDSGNQGVTSATPPVQKPVEVGIANDTLTEIISGLDEGDQIVTKTITATAKTSTTPSILNSIGGNRGGGGGAGAIRAVGR